MFKPQLPCLKNKPLLAFQLVLLLVFVWLYILTIPYLTYGVIKEQQHYLSVSWHMWETHQWVLLHSDLGIYINKPPLLFWMTNLAWFVFGVHNWTLRAIPAFFSLSSIFLLFTLFRQLWPELKSYAWIASLLFLFNWYVFHYTPLYMHDFLLMAFLILSLNALVLARKHFVIGFGLFGVALALGILSKGPVILVFSLPAAFLAPLGFDLTKKTGIRWYLGLIFGLVLMSFVLLIWLVPFWHQIKIHHLEKELMIKLFGGHHQYTRKPWWNYLFVFPAMLLPWTIWPSLYKSIYSQWARIKVNKNILWMLTSFLVVFVVMSLIGAKADRYIMPATVYFSVCAAFFLANAEISDQSIRWQAYPLWFCCILFSIALLIASPFVPALLKKYGAYTEMPFVIFSLILLALSVIALRTKKISLKKSLLMQMLLIFFFYSGFALIVVRTDMKSHHLSQLEKVVNQYASQGHPIAYRYVYGGYRYRVGPGMMPKGLILKDNQAVFSWLEKNKNGIVVAKLPIEMKMKNVFQRFYFDREKKIVLIKCCFKRN